MFVGISMEKTWQNKQLGLASLNNKWRALGYRGSL